MNKGEEEGKENVKINKIKYNNKIIHVDQS